jgi:hypothetical protein
MRQLLKAIVSSVLGLVAGIHSVAAHHSGSMFDHSKSVTVIGTVKEVRWVNPHVTFLVHGATNEGLEPMDWLLEMTSPSVLSRLGWTRTSLKPGDRVRVEFNPLLDDQEHGGSPRKVTSIETGKSYSTNLREPENRDNEDQ